MKKSNDKITNYILHSIGSENIIILDEYVETKLKEQFTEFNNESDIATFFQEDIDYYTIDDAQSLRYYTGRSFAEINNILRGVWNYETNGLLTEEKNTFYRKMADELEKIIMASPKTRTNLIAYRGVTINAFKRYGINSFDDLLNLKGQFIYDSGFLSTSLIRNRSFFNRKLDFANYCNIEIKYLIPNDNEDAVALITNELSYNPEQTEYVICKGNFSKVVDVSIDEKNNLAYITMVYIPKNIWDKTYAKSNKNSLRL